MANMSTQFSCRLEVLDEKYLRICLLLVVDLDLEVELALDNLLNCRCRSSFRGEGCAEIWSRSQWRIAS